MWQLELGIWCLLSCSVIQIDFQANWFIKIKLFLGKAHDNNLPLVKLIY